jgi:hypothetical protein
MSVFATASEVRLPDNRIVPVRELTWFEFLELMGNLQNHLGKLVNAEGNVVLSPEVFAQMVGGAQDLSSFVLSRACGLTGEALTNLRVSDALRLIDAAIGATLTPEMIDLAKKVGARVAAAFGAGKTSMPNSAVSSTV